MNTQSIAIAALLSSLAFTAAAAPATEGAIGSEPVAQSLKSRADVRAELRAAQGNGSYALATDAQTAPATPVMSTASRAEVRQETIAAVAAARRAPLSADTVHVGG